MGTYWHIGPTVHVQLSAWLFAHVSAIKSRQSGQTDEVDSEGGGRQGGRAYFFNRRPVKRPEGTQLWTMKFDSDDDDDVVACLLQIKSILLD